MEAGALDDARRLVATAESGPLSELGLARARLLRGRIAFLATRSTDAAPLAFSMKPEHHRGVRCTRLVGLFF